MEESVHEQPLEMLENLEVEELERFHSYLQDVPVTINKCQLENADKLETRDLMAQTYTNDHVMEVATSILKKLKGQSEEKDMKPLVQYEDTELAIVSREMY